MNLFEAIEKRHSYRGPFKETPVSRSDLEKIVMAGIRAPSGYNGQSTSFVIVDETGLIAQIAAFLGGKNVVAGAGALVVAVMEREKPADREFWFGIEDYSAACANMLLAITALGYASVWIDGALRRDDVAGRIGRILGVPESHKVRVVLPIGMPAERRGPKEKKPFAERAWFNCWRG